ncbi:Uncharacterised protein [Mycolicibacterium aurum]|uniref:Uncharacterized protein n=1 Tax=Mycolicibacterium aurum TaxID=1791 RepID=A0A448IXE5_MYCAU|nr:hypothetical protein [Mycolicibacterium aurum]VEG57085.1 Uncharacterised protein [Mycolicibacterium aurum]
MFRGETPWRDNPTDRQRVICERYAQVIKQETSKVVDPEIIRAVRYVLLRQSGHAIFDSPDELAILTAHAKCNRKRDRLLKLLQDIEDELKRATDNDGLEALILPELRARAKGLGVLDYQEMRKPALIGAIRRASDLGA